MDYLKIKEKCTLVWPKLLDWLREYHHDAKANLSITKTGDLLLTKSNGTIAYIDTIQLDLFFKSKKVHIHLAFGENPYTLDFGFTANISCNGHTYRINDSGCRREMTKSVFKGAFYLYEYELIKKTIE